MRNGLARKSNPEVVYNTLKNRPYLRSLDKVSGEHESAPKALHGSANGALRLAVKKDALPISFGDGNGGVVAGDIVAVEKYSAAEDKYNEIGVISVLNNALFVGRIEQRWNPYRGRGNSFISYWDVPPITGQEIIAVPYEIKDFHFEQQDTGKTKEITEYISVPRSCDYGNPWDHGLNTCRTCKNCGRIWHGYTQPWPLKNKPQPEELCDSPEQKAITKSVTVYQTVKVYNDKPLGTASDPLMHYIGLSNLPESPLRQAQYYSDWEASLDLMQEQPVGYIVTKPSYYFEDGVRFGGNNNRLVAPDFVRPFDPGTGSTYFYGRSYWHTGSDFSRASWKPTYWYGPYYQAIMGFCGIAREIWEKDAGGIDEEKYASSMNGMVFSIHRHSIGLTSTEFSRLEISPYELRITTEGDKSSQYFFGSIEGCRAYRGHPESANNHQGMRVFMVTAQPSVGEDTEDYNDFMSVLRTMEDRIPNNHPRDPGNQNSFMPASITAACDGSCVNHVTDMVYGKPYYNLGQEQTYSTGTWSGPEYEFKWDDKEQCSSDSCIYWKKYDSKNRETIAPNDTSKAEICKQIKITTTTTGLFNNTTTSVTGGYWQYTCPLVQYWWHHYQSTGQEADWKEANASCYKMEGTIPHNIVCPDPTFGVPKNTLINLYDHMRDCHEDDLRDMLNSYNASCFNVDGQQTNINWEDDNYVRMATRAAFRWVLSKKLCRNHFRAIFNDEVDLPDGAIDFDEYRRNIVFYPKDLSSSGQ